MARVQTEVKIASIDVSSYVTEWKIKQTYGTEIDQGYVKLSYSGYLNLIPTADVGATVTIKRGTVSATDYFELDGYVTEIDKDGSHVTLFCAGKLINLTNSDINYSYDYDVDPSAGIGSEIFKDMINTYTDLTCDATSVQSTGSTLILKKFRCRSTDVYERVKALADIYDFQFYYNNDTALVYFEPIGFTASGVTLTVGTEVSEIGKWKFDTSQMVNNLTVRGAEQLVENTETFNGDGVTTTFQLAQVPNSVRVEVGGVLKVGGILGSTATYDYEVDQLNKQIVFVAGSIPGVGVGNVVITYDYPIPIPVSLRNDASITAYGLYSTTKTFSDIQTVDDAINRGNSWLDKYSEPFISVSIKVPAISYGLKPGSTITVVDNYNNQNRLLVITSITKRYPHSYDEYDCGTEQYQTADFQSDVLNKIKRLEEQIAGESDLLINVRQPEQEVQILNTCIVETRDVTTDAIWDVDLWDAASWEGSYDGSTVRIRIAHNNNYYYETFGTTSFKDTVSTTATWDTTNHRVDFIDGQIMQTLAVALNNGSITAATLNLTYTGTLTLLMSSDGGSHWESVTNAVQHTFTDIGQDLRIKATSTGVSQITLMEVDYIV